MIATDGSPGAWAAVEAGVELASEVGADVVFVTVRHDHPLLGDPWYQRRLSEQLVQARAAIDQAELEAARLGVRFESEILEGDPASCITDAADAREADLVVVGSRGHGALASAVIGSVSHALMGRCKVPVMIVRSRTGERSAA